MYSEARLLTQDLCPLFLAQILCFPLHMHDLASIASRGRVKAQIEIIWHEHEGYHEHGFRTCSTAWGSILGGSHILSKELNHDSVTWNEFVNRLEFNTSGIRTKTMLVTGGASAARSCRIGGVAAREAEDKQSSRCDNHRKCSTCRAASDCEKDN